MNIFVVHSGADTDAVKEIIADLESKSPKVNALVLSNGGPFWKLEAKKLIKMSQMVLFAVGQNSHSSKNIDWELKSALKHNKVIICYKLDAKNRINDCLYGKDFFSKKNRFLAVEVGTVDEVAEKVRKHENGEYDVFNESVDKMDRTELLEQYKIFLETSETLVTRRQNVNSFYISANTALVAALGALVSVFDNINERLIICLIICSVGIVLCISWSRLLTAYGILNGSKMKVISIIEGQLPAALYDSEWAIMSDRLNKNSYVSFTDSERRVPKAFVALYVILFVGAVLLKAVPMLF